MSIYAYNWIAINELITTSLDLEWPLPQLCSPRGFPALPGPPGPFDVPTSLPQDGCTRHTVEPGSFTHGMVASCCLVIKAQDRWPWLFKRPGAAGVSMDWWEKTLTVETIDGPWFSPCYFFGRFQVFGFMFPLNQAMECCFGWRFWVAMTFWDVTLGCRKC